MSLELDLKTMHRLGCEHGTYRILSTEGEGVVVELRPLSHDRANIVLQIRGNEAVPEPAR